MSDKFFYLVAALAWLQAVADIFSTYSKTMIPLRIASVVANLAGLVVSAAGADVPAVTAYLVTLPLNFVRLREMRALVRNIKQAVGGDLNVEWLKPFMHPRRLRRGDWLFHRGDAADAAFMLVEGEIELPEIGVTLKPGTLFGEMALFTDENTRTASARCGTDVRLLAITYEEFEQLYFQNPEFGIYLTRLIVRRMRANHDQGERSPALPESAILS